MHSKVPKKTPLLRGEQSKPCKVSPSLEQSEISFPLYIPLTGVFKSAKKTTTTVELWTPDRAVLNNLLRLRQQRVTSRPTLADTELTQVTQATKK